jgi:integrase/recombinase XerD
MNQTSSTVGPLLQTFFAEHLLHHKGVSYQTIASYRDTFRLLLQFVRDRTGREPSSLKLSDLDAPVILSFLNHLEADRHNATRTRNLRLTAIRTFFRLAALSDPENVGLATRVLAIPVKRTDRRLVGYLTRAEMEAILAAPDPKTWSGRRDYALLLTLYNTGARVSEIINVERRHLSFGATTYLELHGKGRKERTVPLWPTTARALKQRLEDLPDATPTAVVFPSARRERLTRKGITFILRNATTTAAVACPSLASKRVSPHIVRHTTAMHLLQSGVDITVIALWLGHESTETTHQYIEADLATKERALATLPDAGKRLDRFKAADALLGFLASL